MILKHYTQRTPFSNIKNLWLQLRALLRSKIDQGPGPARPPAGYTLQFSDDFRKLDWDVWRTGHPWGRNVHTDWQWKWWPDQSELTKYSVVYPTSEGLALELRNFPRTFNRSELPKWQERGAKTAQWTADWCMGCISTRKVWKHGWFEAEIKVPAGKGQWAAFWLSGYENWPPEIDVFETYSTEYGKVDVKPNVHFGKAGTWRDGKRDMGQPHISLKNPQNKWVKYAVHWTDEFIRFYYDGYLVQECAIPDAVKQNAQSQYIILNNGCQNPAETGVTPDESGMLVRNLKVYQL